MVDENEQSVFGRRAPHLADDPPRHATHSQIDLTAFRRYLSEQPMPDFGREAPDWPPDSNGMDPSSHLTASSARLEVCCHQSRNEEESS